LLEGIAYLRDALVGVHVGGSGESVERLALGDLVRLRILSLVGSRGGVAVHRIGATSLASVQIYAVFHEV
jgi:hypothetical protein